MRSRTSRGVPEWSRGEELYIGSVVSAVGKVSGVTGIVPGPPEGSRGSTGWGHLSRRAPWAEVGGEPVGERSRNSKFSYVSPRSIYGETSNEGKESASTYPCRSLSGSVQENGVDGVVLVVIQITGDPSAERTAPPRSTHVQPGDVSHALIQQGERERLRKTPSSSSTTAWWWWRSVAILQGFAKHRGRGGVLGRGGGLRQNFVYGSHAPPHYI